MANYIVGSMIKEARERQGFSQEELSHGICTTSTLSRIENGAQRPGKRILEALTQRLGISEAIYHTFASTEELELYQIGQQLMRMLANRNYQKVEELCLKLRQRVGWKKDKISRRGNGSCYHLEIQYLLFAEASLAKSKGCPKEKVLERMLEAVRVTIPDFNGRHIRNHLLTLHEITIINSIACVCLEFGEHLKGFQLLLELKEYIELHVTDGEEKAEKYPMILQSIASWLGNLGEYDEVLKLCQAGIDCCIHYGKLSQFPVLLFQKACALAELGRIDIARNVFFQSAVLYEATNQEERAERTKRFVRTKYHLEM